MRPEFVIPSCRGRDQTGYSQFGIFLIVWSASIRFSNARKINSPGDVSHQGYVHKMLTGRREAVRKMRQFSGACGFLMRSQSEFDHYGAGHAGTALSAALGMATAR
jgi:hypothetical protein